MIGAIRTWITRLASGRVFVLLLVLFGALALAVNFLPFGVPRLKALSGGVGILDLKFFYGADEAYRMLAAYGPEGRRLYLRGLLTVDLILPPLYALLLAVAIALGFGRSLRPESRLQALSLLPLAVCLADYLENASIVTLLLKYPARIEWLAGVAGYFTLTKQVLSLLCMALSLLGAGLALLRRRRVEAVEGG